MATNCPNVRPWTTNDSIYVSPRGTPCRELSRDDEYITVEFARPSRANDDPRQCFNGFYLWKATIRTVSFLDTFTCA